MDTTADEEIMVFPEVMMTSAGWEAMFEEMNASYQPTSKFVVAAGVLTTLVMGVGFYLFRKS